jgi:hypothetical protein
VSNQPEGARPRVFLHVGSPKTGTTFLQNVLWRQRATASKQGLLLPLERFSDHYLASLDARGLAGRPEHPERAVGMWDKLVAQARTWSGSVLVSHELFAAATAAQAERAVASFGPDVEVHVVLTARDLVRQMAAEWQEHVKHRSTKTFGEFVQDLRADEKRSSWFWKVQDFSGVLARWGASVPSHQVHLVTVPPAGSSPEALWVRFATLLGLDPTSFDTAVPHANTSLGVEQAELLRRVNVELGDRLPLPGPYPVVVKNVLAHQVLAGRTGTRLRLDPSDTEFALEESQRVAERLKDLGVDVVGSLDDLLPDPAKARAGASAEAYLPPDDGVLLQESLAAVTDLLVRLSERRGERAQAEMYKRMKDRPVRFALLAASERHRGLMRLRKAYERWYPPEGAEN